MKKKYYFILSMIMMMGMFFFRTSQVEAAPANGSYTWGTQGLSTIVDPANPKLNISNDTVQFVVNPNYTTYKLMDGTTIKSSEIPSTGKFVSLDVNQSMEITNIGSYKGEKINLKIRNIAERNGSYTTLKIMPNGNIECVIDGRAVDGYAAFYKVPKQFELTFLDYNGNLLRNIPVLLTQTQQNNDLSKQVVYGYDISGFQQLFAISKSTVSSSVIGYNSYNFGRIAVNSVSSAQKFTYATYTTTSYDGKIILYGGAGTYDNASTRKGMDYNLFNPSSDYSVAPLLYPTTESSVANQTTDAGKYINITTKQLLVTQKYASFYPTAGSLNLALNESNVSHLQITKDDFTLSTENGTIPSSAYNVTVSQNANGTAAININFLSSFASQYAGQTVTINQKSMINPDKTIVNNNLVGNQLPISLGTQLTYKMSSAVQTNTNMSILTNKSDFKFTVVPDLTATVASNYTVGKGTTMMDIPIEEVVTNMKNVYFPWDDVSAEFENENQTLNVGANKVNIILKSAKFNYSKTIVATINVVDNYTLTYDGNGGTIDGQATKTTTFTKTGTPLIGAANVSRKGYVFLGWSTSPTDSSNPLKENYTYGTIASEQKNTTLYACWKKDEYKLTYNGNGGTVDGKTTSDVTFMIDGTTLLDKSKVVRKGYTFTGWSTIATGEVAYQAGYVYGKLDAEMKDTTLYACWKKDEYKLTYNGNGGTIDGKTTSDVTFTIDGTALLNGSKVVRKGYTFTGWSTTATGEVVYQAGYVYGKLDTEMKNATLYACWKKDEYKLAYNGNGGTIDGKTISDNVLFTVDGVTLLDNSKVIRKGYTFVGWSTTATGEAAYQANYVYGKLDTELKDTTLYACWKIDEHTLTYNGNGGTINGQTTTKVPFTIEGIKLLGAASVVRDNYTFLGWSTSPTDSTKLLKEGYIYGTIDAELKDTTLYACWEETTRITVSWTADKIETSATEKVDRADSTSTMSFYWNFNKKGTQYLIKQKITTQQTDLKKIIQENDTDVLKKDTVEINTETLAYGDNQMTIEFYQLDATGKVLTSDKPDAILNLTITINGSLRLASVPDSLYWTNRLSDSSVGILDRDTNNDIKLSVIDSRENQSADWAIQASLTMVEEDIPFGFVWKNSTSSSDIPMNENAITIMDKNSANQQGSYEFSQT